MHAVPHNSLSIINCLHMFHSDHEVAQSLHPRPEGFDAGFAVALSGEEATKHGDLSDNLPNGGYGLFPGIRSEC